VTQNSNSSLGFRTTYKAQWPPFALAFIIQLE